MKNEKEEIEQNTNSKQKWKHDTPTLTYISHTLSLSKHTHPPLNLYTHLPTGKIRRLDGGIHFGEVESHLLHEPAEGFALEALSDGPLLCQVARVDAAVGWTPLV